MGEEAFLEKYGFGGSRSYWLIWKGRQYDSKAILGAAHGFARPDLGPMSAADFSGGKTTVARVLEDLGFEVDMMDESVRAPDAFLLTWKAAGWPHENLVRMVKALAAEGFVDEPWRLRAHRQAKVGDRVWLLKQGPGPKGIFGEGVVIAPITLQDAGNGKQQPMAPVRFSRLVDPELGFLIDEDESRRILGNQIRIQGSGYPLTPDQSAALERAAGPSRVIQADEADDTPFDPAGLEDARERILRSIAQRRGQKAFRDALLRAYGGRCAITDCEVKHVLEAAHIVPYIGPDTNRTDNGLLLRADIHTLFDCGLVTIDPATRTVVIAASLHATEYGSLSGKLLRSPVRVGDAPSALALERRADAFRGKGLRDAVGRPAQGRACCIQVTLAPTTGASGTERR